MFVILAVELSDQQPDLAAAVTGGFVRFKDMIRRLLEQERLAGNLRDGVDTRQATELIFSGILGASVMYISDKSIANLDRTVKTLIHYLEGIQI